MKRSFCKLNIEDDDDDDDGDVKGKLANRKTQGWSGLSSNVCSRTFTVLV